MAVTLSVGSGKGGAGKSMIVANLSVLLAKAGRRVCVVDLDLGGADTHVAFGIFEPEKSVTDFLTRKVAAISETIQTLDSLYSLELIAGTGNTLRTANMTFQEKQRLLRALKTIDTDVLILDVGAGTNYHVLDFFMYADIQLCVTCPDPAAIVDFYTFLQLATIRKALSSFLSGGEVSKLLKEKPFETLTDVFDLAEQIQSGAREKAQQALIHFNPLLTINQVDDGAKINLLKLRKLAAKYLGIYLPDIGEIPVDPHIPKALKNYLPVCEYAPDSIASKALQHMAVKLGRVIDLFISKKK
ncbi:MAG: ATP-binding protein [Proteobacteria bacterium]|nr:MAG: ATP-binding protein [Pseudomonadota bacterium]